ncbi:NAD(+) salvage pathway protein [Lobaria immixta]|nr:NAD(+) salvage pathway protein [Lobaria immixta]
MAATRSDTACKTALLVVDMQEDFCPPNGSLAIEGGRALAPTINKLLSLPYALKIATKDFHPNDHVSFDTSHTPPHNKPFESSVTITNPLNPTESQEIPIWPVHCVQGTKGAEIIPEIDASKFDLIMEKGKDNMVEMFSAFADVFGNKSGAASLDLAALLRIHNVHRVHIVGLAGDYCVKCTALDASKEGFEVFVVNEGVGSVNKGREGWEAVLKEFQIADIKVVSIEGPEITALT